MKWKGKIWATLKLIDIILESNLQMASLQVGDSGKTLAQ